MTERDLCAIFSSNLRRMKDAKGLTTRELATKCGVAFGTVRHLHKGHSLPTTVTFVKLIEGLDTTPMEFFR